MVPYALALAALLCVGPGPIEFEIETHGGDLNSQIERDGRSQQAGDCLRGLGCGRLAVAMWTGQAAFRLKILVACAEWRWRDPRDPWAILRG